MIAASHRKAGHELACVGSAQTVTVMKKKGIMSVLDSDMSEQGPNAQWPVDAHVHPPAVAPKNGHPHTPAETR